MLNMRNLKKGFTLVELIVVVTILAVLATVAFLTLWNYPADARDSKRLGQAKSIYNKIEILKAKDPKEYDHYIASSASTTEGIETGFSEVKHWLVNFTNIQESATAFNLPTTAEKYYVVTATETTPWFKCIQIYVRNETKSGTEKDFNVIWNCTKNIVNDATAKAQVEKAAL